MRIRIGELHTKRIWRCGYDFLELVHFRGGNKKFCGRDGAGRNFISIESTANIIFHTHPWGFKGFKGFNLTFWAVGGR